MPYALYEEIIIEFDNDIDPFDMAKHLALQTLWVFMNYKSSQQFIMPVHSSSGTQYNQIKRVFVAAMAARQETNDESKCRQSY